MAIAVRTLRGEKDARAALIALDNYRARYPHGRFAIEASILHVDALTAADRSGEALRMLDGLDLSRVPGAPERYLERGELRARSGRWGEARSDFDWVLSHVPEPDSSLLERALAARAQAWQHEGNQDQARKDAADYLSRFPRGRFAAQASALMATGGR